MAVTSDAMYNTITTGPSFMSGNMYYGYLSNCRSENNFNNVFGHTVLAKPSMIKCYSYDTAMEIEDDACDHVAASQTLHNNSMILETSLQNRLQGNNRQQQAGEDAGTLQRRNRKRCFSDSSPASELKRFRKGGGKDKVHLGARSTMDYGLATVPHESEALHVDIVNNNLEQSMIVNRNYYWPVNDNMLNNSDSKQLLCNDRSMSFENNVDYEKILFETHGCSIYQYHRLQLVGNDCSEAEF